MTKVITQPQKLHSQLVELLTVDLYQVTGLNCSFVYGMGLQLAIIIHNNLAGDTHHLLFFHVRPANQSTITGVDLCHKSLDINCSAKHMSFDNNHPPRSHSECHTVDKGSNKICENYVILHTNIQRLKIQVRN
jgi:hypothetical protein